jgi:hypothetical protein
MADTKISALTAQTATGSAVGDLVVAVDISDTTMAASGTNKKVTLADFTAGIRSILANASTAAQGAGFATDTYLTGSNIAIPSGYPIVGTTYKLIFDVTKTAAGTVAPILQVRIGTAGTTADASICSFTFGAGTAAVDTGVFEAVCTFRTVGSGTSAVLQGITRLVSNLTTTGLSNAVKSKSTTSAGFNSTTASSIIGASYNGGTSASHTIQLVRAELIL